MALISKDLKIMQPEILDDLNPGASELSSELDEKSEILERIN